MRKDLLNLPPESSDAEPKQHYHYLHVPLLYCRPHHVCHPIQHGASGIATVQDRNRADRLGLRGGQHADHDTGRFQRPASTWRRRFCQVPPLCGQTTAPDWSVNDCLVFLLSPSEGRVGMSDDVHDTCQFLWNGWVTNEMKLNEP